jgi:hypothetical protein
MPNRVILISDLFLTVSVNEALFSVKIAFYKTWRTIFEVDKFQSSGNLLISQVFKKSRFSKNTLPFTEKIEIKSKLNICLSCIPICISKLCMHILSNMVLCLGPCVSLFPVAYLLQICLFRILYFTRNLNLKKNEQFIKTAIFYIYVSLRRLKKIRNVVFSTENIVLFFFRHDLYFICRCNKSKSGYHFLDMIFTKRTLKLNVT